MKNKDIDIFSITDFLDKARWEDAEKRSPVSLVNYADPSFYCLPNENSILVHYLCYITDRQMPYQRIWNVGGFIFSDLIKHYTSTHTSVSDLLDVNGQNTYIKLLKGGTKEYLTFAISLPQNISNQQLYLLGDAISENTVSFSSRFVTTDYRSIYNVLYILRRLAEEEIIEKPSIVDYIKKNFYFKKG